MTTDYHRQIARAVARDTLATFALVVPLLWWTGEQHPLWRLGTWVGLYYGHPMLVAIFKTLWELTRRNLWDMVLESQRDPIEHLREKAVFRITLDALMILLAWSIFLVLSRLGL